MKRRWLLACSVATMADARDGVIGMRFVEAVVASHAAGGRWTDATFDV
jgi:hypothetical protein